MNQGFHIGDADPQGHDAMGLLHEAYAEAQSVYPELFKAGSPAPTNAPTPWRGVFLVVTAAGLGSSTVKVQTPLACGALRPLSATVAEVKRMFVTASARQQGVASALLRELEARARELGFVSLQLETGYKQQAAMALYTREGYVPIEPYGEHGGDPTSRCFAKQLEVRAQGKS